MKKIFRGNILNLIHKSNLQIQDCKKCQNFFYFEDKEKCFIYENPNHGISICHDFQKIEE